MLLPLEHLAGVERHRQVEIRTRKNVEITTLHPLKYVLVAAVLAKLRFAARALSVS